MQGKSPLATRALAALALVTLLFAAARVCFAQVQETPPNGAPLRVPDDITWLIS